MLVGRQCTDVQIGRELARHAELWVTLLSAHDLYPYTFTAMPPFIEEFG